MDDCSNACSGHIATLLLLDSVNRQASVMNHQFRGPRSQSHCELGTGNWELFVNRQLPFIRRSCHCERSAAISGFPQIRSRLPTTTLLTTEARRPRRMQPQRTARDARTEDGRRRTDLLPVTALLITCHLCSFDTDSRGRNTDFPSSPIR
jgi:5-methylcytosine-specific restriction endonuclease McrA